MIRAIEVAPIFDEMENCNSNDVYINIDNFAMIYAWKVEAYSKYTAKKSQIHDRFRKYFQQFQFMYNARTRMLSI